MQSEVDIYYFSGTGNTFLVVKELARRLKERHKHVRLFRIEESNPGQIELTHTIGLAFPVAISSTYPFIWDFIKRLPQTVGTEVFMLDTLAMFSGGIVGPLKKVLKQKGYKTAGAKEIRMPGNYGRFIPNEVKKEVMIKKALRETREYAEDLFYNRSKWHRIPLLSDIVCLLSKWSKIWEAVNKRISIDYERCITCGLCAKLCPVKNIALRNEFFGKGADRPEHFGSKDEGYPQMKNHCIMCMRCVAFCPKNAILYQRKQKRYAAVKVDKIIKD